MTLWVFGYGSLLWNPGFAVVERAPARRAGWRRGFCMWSVHYRGTPARPGLVLALDWGAVAAQAPFCDGTALRVAPGTEPATLAYLRDRELPGSAYVECHVPLALTDGRQITALTYVIDRSHPLYCDLPLPDQARIIAGAAGDRGPNRDYLWNTAAHLAACGIHDPDIAWLADRVQQIHAAEGSDSGVE